MEIPSGVKNIGNYAFKGCRSLTSVEIPSSVTSIEDGAFEDCPIIYIYIENCKFKILRINDPYNIRLIIYNDDQFKDHVIINFFKNIGFKLISYKNLRLQDISYLTLVENLINDSYDLSILDEETKNIINNLMEIADKELKDKMKTIDGYRKKRKSKSIKMKRKSKSIKKKSKKMKRKSKSLKKKKKCKLYFSFDII